MWILSQSGGPWTAPDRGSTGGYRRDRRVHPEPDGRSAPRRPVAVTGIGGEAGSTRFYAINVPAGATQLTVVMSGGTANLRRDDPAPETGQ